MLIARSPLRISLGGGGTDLPSYYREHGGFLVAGAITKYIYITVHRTYGPELIVKYSKLERVAHSREIEHPIIREAFALLGLDGKYLELTSMADIPAGTGLGSSGSFTTALLKALHSLKHEIANAETIAAQACHIEIDRLKEPVGKQDPYIAAFGGLTCFEFLPDDTVKAWPLALDQHSREELEDSLVLFFTGYSRSASAILGDQDQKSKSGDAGMIRNLHLIKELGLRSKKALESGALEEFGDLMNEHWQYKKERSRGMSNAVIDDLYDYARANGALGGKLIGAGGGGFLLFYAADKRRLLRAMRAKGLTELRFGFDFEGATLLIRDH
jgi:D-glycero-alpha-D-manno-heptose-7-phosphate kinase